MAIGKSKGLSLPARRGKITARIKTHSKASLSELRPEFSTPQNQAIQKITRELENSHEAFDTFYNNGAIACVMLNGNGRILDSNAAAARMLGVPLEEISRRSFSSLVRREDLRSFLNHLKRCNAGERNVVTELRLKTSGKNPFSVRLVSSVIARNGRVLFATALAGPGEFSTREDDLARAREVAANIVQTIREPLAVLDADLKIVLVNRAFEQYFNCSSQSVRNQFLDVLLNLWWSGNLLRNELENVLEKNQPLEDFPIEVQPAGLTPRVLLMSARRLYQRNDSPALILVALEDITERKQAEEQIRRLNEELEKRVAGRTEALRKSYEQMESFCYSIAHDLRAPLRALKGFGDLLMDEFGAKLGGNAMDYTRRMSASAARMDRLICDLLEYGQLNTLDLPIEETDADEILDRVLAEYQTEIETKRAKIQKQRRLPRVFGHPLVLQVAFKNLLSNALKFVAQDIAPRIHIWPEQRENFVRICVRDNGIGIAPENHAKIFGVFQRLHGSTNYPGTGIGLALVSKGLERIGGRVGVESDIGKGSVFWIELRAKENAGVKTGSAR
ncbi:MAG TPA: ATP-binding protein [Verrucomicrobiae bacterium]|nr:ATP-binding protein [Verrucomicrobiae bacterium]